LYHTLQKTATGVVSTWRLEMPKDTNSFDFNTIQDVVIHLKYSAKADNGKFRTMCGN